LRVRVDEPDSAGPAALIKARLIMAVLLSVAGSLRTMLVKAGQITTRPMDLGRWYWGEFAGRRTETGASPFPASGT
jgi:hypothetical protein